MIRLADYIFKYLEEYGINDIFMISGGGAMHLNDALGRNKNIRYICNHHEQACAIAAEGYARIANKLSVVVVTTGPGGTNSLTGLIGQWLDSVPVLYISGQVKFETSIASCQDLNLRQLGDQEINIIDIVRPVTKYAKMVTDPLDIKLELDKAIKEACTGRFGPVWLDIPLNIQGANIEESQLNQPDNQPEKILFDPENAIEKIHEVAELILKSERPIILAGNGIRNSKSIDKLLELIKLSGIPVVTSFLGCDIIETDSKYFAGRIGTIGTRSGNFAVQNADLLISIGSRNNIRQTSYNWDWFARGAKKIVVDIDGSELKKPTFKPDIPVHCDALFFIDRLISDIKLSKLPDFTEWVDWCQIRLKKYPAYLPEYAFSDELVNPYHFIKKLTEAIPEETIVVTANATPSIVYHQVGIVKKNQRILWNSGCASMGYGLPAAIGAAFAGKNKEVVCLEGDGSIQMNIQELQTIVQHKLPVKLFILDNRSYISIKQTQTNLFGGFFVGSDTHSGISFPDFSKVAEAYGLKTIVIDNHRELGSKLSEVLNSIGPVACIVRLIESYTFVPKTSSRKLPDGRIVSAPLEDMFPFLDRDEFLSNMIIDPLDI